MKKIIITIAVFCLLFSLTTPLLGKTTEFSDTKGHWAENYITFLAENDLISGYPDGTFRPQRTITRGELVTILALDAKATLSDYDKASSFPDVKNHWSKNAINWAVEKKFIVGYPDKTFGPNREITREEIARMIHQYTIEVSKVSLPKTHEIINFKDEKQIGAWAKDDVAIMQQCGIISGTPERTFLPKNKATRAESGKMIADYVTIANGGGVTGQGNTSIYLNNTLVKKSVVIAESKGKDMIGARDFFSAIGYEIKYYNNSGLLAAYNHEKDMEMWIGKTTAYAKGNRITLVTPPVLSNNTSYIPLDSLATALSITMVKNGWGTENQALYITMTPTAVSTTKQSFYGSAQSSSDVKGQIKLDTTTGFLGTINKGQMQYGAYVGANNALFLGTWSNSTMNGTGRKINGLGELSIGTFSNGHLTEGTTYFSDGSYFTGKWHYNTNSNGTIYPDTGTLTTAQGETYGSSSTSWSNGALTINK